MKDLAIPAADYGRRFQKIQEFLKREGLGALLAFSPPMEHKWGQTGHVSYLSGWASHDRSVNSIVVVPARGRPTLLFAGMAFMRELILEVSPLDDVRMVRAVDPHDIAVDATGSDAPRGFVEEVLSILQENDLEGKGVGLVGIESMPAPLHRYLREGLGEQVRDVKDVVAELRYVKSPGEIKLMRRAAELSDLGFEAMLTEARPGMRGIEIVAEMERVIRREGADHAKYWLASGPPPDWANIRLDIKPHLRVLEEGDFIWACSYVCYKGYWSHGHRVGALRKPCPKLEELCRIGREAQEAGLLEMRPGMPVGQITKEIRKEAAKYGWEIEGGRVGHGIGLDYTENPTMFERNQSALEAGTTVIVHSGFRLPDTSKMFIPLGDLCHVTDGGPELLMSFPRTPFIAGA